MNPARRQQQAVRKPESMAYLVPAVSSLAVALLLLCAEAAKSGQGLPVFGIRGGGNARAEAPYSFSLTTFTPHGSLTQIEYARNSASGGALSVAVTYKGGIVMGTVSKAESPLVMDVGTRKFGWLTNGIVMTYAGVAADSRVLTKKAEACCLGYRGKFGETGVVPVGTLVADIAMTMQEYTQMGGVRPFGVALLVAGLDLNGLKLFRLDSAGSYSAWKAVAIGKGSAEAEVILHQNFKDSMTREGALELVLDVVERCCSGTRREDVETAFIEIPSCRDPQ